MKEEKPTLYIVSGHRGAGKTQLLKQIYPVGEKLMPVNLYNDKIRKIQDRYQHDQDFTTYFNHLNKAFDEERNYVKRQSKNNQNIYFESDGRTMIEMINIENRLHDSYLTHTTFVMCDSFEDSFARLQANLRPSDAALDRGKLESDYNMCNHMLNWTRHTEFGNLDIYDGSNNMKLIASFREGNIITASPELLQKSWLKPNVGTLRPIVHNYLNQEKIKKANQHHHQKQHARSETAIPEKRNRLRM